MTNEEKLCHLAAVRTYWRENHTAYLDNVGPTFQAGLFFQTDEADINTGFSNCALALAAGIRPGSRILDAGCGVCGPAIDIARFIPAISIDAVTISPEQAQTARAGVHQASLAGSIRVILADYHRLPFATATFDHVCYFESSCYSWSLDELFTEAFRVIRPGGGIYVKDVFRREGVLTDQEQADLKLFDATYCNHSSAMSEAAAALEAAGFKAVRTQDLTGAISTVHAQLSLFRFTPDDVELSTFGERHFQRYKQLPTCFGQLTAVKP
jgi:cyclopropane fatty-acyl-phospholipid synthase-like methyltransferase